MNNTLHPGERLITLILLLLGAVHLAYHAAGDTGIVWDAFLGGLVLYGLFIWLGIVLRLFGRLPRLSATLIALGSYPVYASLMALINYLQFPLPRPMIDELLYSIDAAFGYDWAAGVAWLADNPGLSMLLSRSYFSALPQLAVLVLVLGLTGRLLALHRMMLTGMLAGMMAVGFWTLFPSFGPSVLVEIDSVTAERAGLKVTNDYGDMLLRLAGEGPGLIERHKMLGVIAFPSMHIVMAALAVWFARGTWIFLPVAMNSAVMVPATALHGGHHLVDLWGGLAVFGLALWLASWLLQRYQVITFGTVRPVRATSPVNV